MAFSKGKRIEDETSTRIENLVVKIGCNEGPEAITVTRICRELNCDRRVVYNRFRDVDELAKIVSNRCGQELVDNAKLVLDKEKTYYENFERLIESIFEYTFNKKAYFQYYTAMYEITDDGIKNQVLQFITDFLKKGKEQGVILPNAEHEMVADNIWLILISAGEMLATNSKCRYEDIWNVVLYGIKAIYKSITNERI